MCETIDAAEHPERALASKAQRSRAGDAALPRSDAPVCLDLRAASVEFRGRIALAEASITVARGEAVAILGPSGAGKTTLLRLLGASLKPVRGEVVANGSPLHAFSPRELKRLRARIGFVHQNHDLVPNLRVIQNVLSGRLGRYGFLGSLREVFVPPKSSVRRIHEILERVGIPDKLYERTDTLSLGEQQRVAIARALYQEPDVLLADEPVASVDPARASDTVELLVEIARERRLALCVSLHDVALARQFFPRLVGLRAGRIVFDKRASELAESDFRALYALASEPTRNPA